MKLTVGSLFSGIGGFDLGFERAGFEIKWQCEIDPYCRAVLAKHWPEVTRYFDVRQLKRPERVDVLCGGFPCQDISDAGLRAGIDGERSGLWSEIARAAGLVRPRYIVVENVAALLGRGLGRVLGDLAALGYDAEWDCLPAAAFGAHHRRDRIFILAYPAGSRNRESKARVSESDECVSRREESAADVVRRRETLLADAESDGMEGERLSAKGRGRMANLDRRRADVSDASSRRQCAWKPDVYARQSDAIGGCEAMAHASLGERCRGPVWAGWRERSASSLAEAYERHGGAEDGIWTVEPDVGRVAHGIPHRVDRLRGLGNAIVPQIAEWIARRILETESQS